MPYDAELPEDAQAAPPTEKTLLLLSEDAVLCRRLDHTFGKLGFITTIVGSVAAAVQFVRASPPAFALLALRLEDGSGLKVMHALRERRPDARIVMLTGHGSIATAVMAIRAGAADYLIKPASDEEVVRAVLGGPTVDAPAPAQNQKSADRVRWEHIQSIYEMTGRNISRTARGLGMYRRTLQRTLARQAPL